MKKLITFIFVFFMAIFVFACSNNKLAKYEKLLKNNDKSLTINVWTYYNNTQKTAFDEIVADFNATVGKEKKIVIKHQSFASTTTLAEELVKSASGAASAADFPHIFQSYADDLMNLDFNYNNIASLDKYFTDNELNNFIDGIIDEGRYDKEGNLKLIPFAKSNEILMINETDFNVFKNSYTAKSYSVDDFKTYERLLDMATAYNQTTGKALFGRDAMANTVFVNAVSLNKPLFTINSDTYEATITFDEDYFQKLYDYHYVPYVKNYYSTKSSFHTGDIATGNVLACVGSTAGVSYFPQQVTLSDSTEDAYDITGIVGAPTLFEGGEKYIISQGAGLAVSLTDELYEYASVLFLKHLTSKENNIKLAVKLGCYLPVTKDSLNYNLIKDEYMKLRIAENPDKTKEQLEKETKNIMVLSTYSELIELLKTYKMYAPAPFINSFSFRKVIDNCIEGSNKPASMANLINGTDMVKLINEDIANGKTFEEAYNQRMNGNFEVWFAELQRICVETVKVK